MEAFAVQLDGERIEQGEFAGVPTPAGTKSLNFVVRRFGNIHQRQDPRACSRTEAPIWPTLPSPGRYSLTPGNIRQRPPMFRRHDEMPCVRVERIGFIRPFPQ